MNLLRLTEDDGHLFVEGDAVAEVWAAVLVGFDGFFHEGDERGFAFLGRFIEANNVFLERFKRFRNFRLKGVNGHGVSVSGLK